MRRWIALVVAACLLSACSPTSHVIIVPTLAQLATDTPSPSATLTDTATASATFTATATDTPSATPIPPTPTITPTVPRDQQMETAHAQITALNATIYMLTTPTPSLIPSPTPTTPPAVINLTPQYFSVRGTAQLRQCPALSCADIATIHADSLVMVTALIYGEAVDFGNGMWYQVQMDGNVIGYVYSALLVPAQPGVSGQTAQSFPTLPPASIPSAAAGSGPNLSQPVDPSLCPDAHSTCTSLQTCDQARACLAAGDTRLDRDGDGVPCESLCAAPGS